MSPTSKLYEILVLSFFWSRILRLFPPVVSISSPGPLTREVGEDVVFMFNATNILEVLWGIRDGNTNNLRQGLISYNIQDGVQLDKKLDSSSYAGRVSFVGNVTKGQAWFKIRNLNINDTNEYMTKIFIQGTSNYRNIPVKLTVIQPATLDSPSLLQRESGEDVVFMFNASTNILEVRWGIRDGDTHYLKPVLMTVDTLNGVRVNSGASSYAGRVIFVGNLTKGQAWFKITNLNINDTNQYMAKILTQGASNYKNSPVQLTVIQPATVPTSKLLLPSTTTATSTSEGSTTSFQITTSPEPTTMIISKDKSSSDSTCTTVIAISVTINVGLVLVVVFLVLYIWKGKKRKGKDQRRQRSSKNLKGEEPGVYENTHQTEITSESVSPQVSGKGLYETLSENRDEGTTNPHAYTGHGLNMVKVSRSATANIQGPLSSLPQHYQELRRQTPQAMPLYEPLNQRNIVDRTESTGDTKTYEQLQQNKPGRDYQSLKKYANVESKV